MPHEREIGNYVNTPKKLVFHIQRCYNCGAVGSHIAPKCTVGPQPKRCHQVIVDVFSIL